MLTAAALTYLRGRDHVDPDAALLPDARTSQQLTVAGRATSRSLDDTTRIPEDVLTAAHDRAKARAERDWATADRLRSGDRGGRLDDRRPRAPTSRCRRRHRPTSTRERGSATGRRATSPLGSRSRPRASRRSCWSPRTGRTTSSARSRRSVRMRRRGPRSSSSPTRRRRSRPRRSSRRPTDADRCRGRLDLGAPRPWRRRRTSASAGRAAPIVVLIDTSVEPTGDVVTPLVRALDDPSVAVAGGWGHHLDRPADLRGRAGRRRRRDRGLPAWRSAAADCRRPRPAGRAVPLLSQPRHLVEPRPARRRGEDDRRAGPSVVGDLPVVRHEHRGWTSLPDEERDRQSKRNFYRIIDRFGSRRDLLVARREATTRLEPGDRRDAARRDRASGSGSSSMDSTTGPGTDPHRGDRDARRPTRRTLVGTGSDRRTRRGIGPRSAAIASDDANRATAGGTSGPSSRGATASRTSALAAASRRDSGRPSVRRRRPSRPRRSRPAGRRPGRSRAPPGGVTLAYAGRVDLGRRRRVAGRRRPRRGAGRAPARRRHRGRASGARRPAGRRAASRARRRGRPAGRGRRRAPRRTGRAGSRPAGDRGAAGAWARSGRSGTSAAAEPGHPARRTRPAGRRPRPAVSTGGRRPRPVHRRRTRAPRAGRGASASAAAAASIDSSE